MQKNDTAPTLKYWGTLALLGICLAGCAACAIFGIECYSNGQPATWLFIIAGILLVTVFILNKVQLKLRDKVEYDQFGQSRKHNDFSKLSAAERKRIEEAKMLESERLLPSTELNAMTHKGVKDPDKEIERLIGLPQVKKMTREMAAQMEYDKKFKNKKNNEEHVYHMCFSGPPGTGKTTVARIMTGLLYKYGVIKQNKCIETDGNVFHGTTPDESAQKTRKILHRANGGVLFIDEAYALIEGRSGANREVIATLIKEMEDNRDGIVIILAGYEQEMKRLIESNPGFKSRIQHYLSFEPYDMNALKQIFTLMATQEGYAVTEVAYDKFEEIIEPMMKTRYFGNGRTVRNIVQASISKHKINCMTQKGPIVEGRVKTLVYEDIAAPQAMR